MVQKNTRHETSQFQYIIAVRKQILIMIIDTITEMSGTLFRKLKYDRFSVSKFVGELKVTNLNEVSLLSREPCSMNKAV